ncbi:MAG TPA: DNA polymerase IV [Acidimicrobiales bacterium]|nr:DNA polymerase IV [Acidimicrobiales bacterium]
MPARTGEPAILHVDMDAFYASVEVLRDPSLAGRPVIVGGAGDRGVVASCSYEARAHGVASAMPSARARRLCPAAVFVHGDLSRYGDYSRRIHEVFASYTPLVEGISLDEAFLDVAGARRLFGSAPEIAAAVRRRIADEVGLGCSVGVAPSKLLAKLASKRAKPRASPAGVVPGPGVVVVRPGEELAFLHPLPVSALWGVGPRTAQRLEGRGVRTVGELAAVPRATVVEWLGAGAGAQLWDLAWARDPRPVVPSRPPKSVGHEETFAVDLRDRHHLHREVVRQADAVAARLRAAGLAGRTVTVKVRYNDFATITRSRTLPEAVDTAPEVAAAAGALLDGVDPRAGVRLLGVSVANLARGAARQLALGGAGPGWGEASEAVDGVRARFGPRAVGPAALLGERGLGVRRPGDQQWGPEGGSAP